MTSARCVPVGFVVDSDARVGNADRAGRACERRGRSGIPQLTRYIPAVLLRPIVLVIALIACGPKPDPKTGGSGAGGAGGNGSGAGSGSAKQTGGGPVGSVPDVGCLKPSCAYHAGANGYFTCLSGGSGACFHFGGPCMPKDSCMYDVADRTYKQCARGVEGMCQQWGAACAPASACMFSPADGLHHKCDELAGGSCKKSGALCAP
jgi:hypothetical protein